jgi:hypothetical protein
MVSSGVDTPATWWKRWSGVAYVVLWTAIGAGALLLLAKSVQNAGEFGRLQPIILLLNLVGVIALTTLIARKLLQLVRDYRDHVPGSRLTARTVAIFGALVIAPLLIIYLFSLEFLNRGIDSWFRVEVKQSMDEAVELSRSALGVREYSQRTERFVQVLANTPQKDIGRRTLSARLLRWRVSFPTAAISLPCIACRRSSRSFPRLSCTRVPSTETSSGIASR